MAITPLEQKIKDIRSTPVDVVSDFPTKTARIGEEINIGAETALRQGKDQGENIASVIKKGKGTSKNKLNVAEHSYIHKPKRKLLGGLN